MSPVKSQGKENAIRKRTKPKTASNGSQQKIVRKKGSKASQAPSKVLNRKQKAKENSQSPEMKHNKMNKANGIPKAPRDKEITGGINKPPKLKPPPKVFTLKPERVNNKLPNNSQNKRSNKETKCEIVESESDTGSSVEVTEVESSDNEKDEHQGRNEEPAESQESEQNSEEQAKESDSQKDTEHTAKYLEKESTKEAKSRSNSEDESVTSATEDDENKQEVEASEAIVSDGIEDSKQKTTTNKVYRHYRQTPRHSKPAEKLNFKMFKKINTDVQAEKTEKKMAKAEKERFEEETEQKAEEGKRNKKPQKEDKPSSVTEEIQPLKGLSLKQADGAAKAKTQLKIKTKNSNNKDAPGDVYKDIEEEVMELTLSTAIEGQNQIMLLKAKGKNFKAILEPGVQQDTYSFAKGHPQSLLLEKDKNASLEGKANRLKLAKLDEDTSSIENKQGTRKSKSNILNHRMVMRAISKKSLTSRKKMSFSKDKMAEEKVNLQLTSGEVDGEIEAKYAVVLPRMNKNINDRQIKTLSQEASGSSTPLRTTGSPEEFSTSECTPLKPGARLVLSVTSDLNILKSIKKPLLEGLKTYGDVAKTVPVSFGPKESSNTKDKDRRNTLDNKNEVNVLHAEKGKLYPSQINMTKMSLSGGMVGGGLNWVERSDAAEIPRSSTQPFPNGEANTVMSGVWSLYEEDTDREVAQLMGEGGLYAGNPLMSGDPQDWLQTRNLLPHQTVEKLTKWTVNDDGGQARNIPIQNARDPWELEDPTQEMLESQLVSTLVGMPSSIRVVDEVDDLSQLE
ncbi:hypothetical protein Q8A73_021647 [Channa argus]|nr:hypothetical protein Q8A73_021647 [Channa argus]